MDQRRPLESWTALPVNPAPDSALTDPPPEGPRRLGARASSSRGPAPDLTTVAAGAGSGRSRLGDGGPWVAIRPEATSEAAEGARPAGPLDDLTVGVKDLVAVAGQPVGAGTKARAAAPPEPRDAAVVSALRRAGALILGRLALHELAFGVTGINDQVGFPGHPMDPDRVPGGSSSGSAVAVATGGCDLAVGTDTGGSARIPAALCGVVGFKPSRGRYPNDGVLALSPRLDHVGLLARNVGDVARAHRVLAGEKVESVRPTRLGLDRAALEAADDIVAERVEGVLRKLTEGGCELVELSWPDPWQVREVSTVVMWAEATHVHGRLLDAVDGPEVPGVPAALRVVDAAWGNGTGRGTAVLGADVAERLAEGATVSEPAYADALAEAAVFTAQVRTALATVDAVVGPTVPLVAPPAVEARSDPGVSGRLVSATRLANVTGTPAVSMPLGWVSHSVAGGDGAPSGDDLPVGFQVQARSDRAALGLARWLEERISAGWATE